jgi:hypothetical protein
MYTGKLGTIDAQPGNIILGGQSPNEGGEIDVDATSALALTSEARSKVIDVSATSSLALTQSAATPVPWHAAATSAIVATTTAGSSIKSVSASSALSLTQSARANAVDLFASSPITLTSTGRSNIMLASGSSPVSLTQMAEAGAVTGIASSALSLTQTVIVSGGSYPVTATSPISLVSAAVARGTLRQSPASVLVLTNTADAVAPHYAVASSAIAITQSGRSGAFNVTASNNLVFLDTVTTFGRPLSESPSSSLSLTQSASIRPITTSDASSSLALTQSAHTLRAFNVSAVTPLTVITPTFDIDTFTFIDVVTGLQDSASYAISATHLAHTIISFASEAQASHVRVDAIAADAANALSLTSSVRTSLQASASSSLTLTQSASAQTGIEAKTELSTLGVRADVTIVRGVSASNTLEIKQAVSFIFEKGDTLCTYSPFVGSSSDPNAPTPPPASYTDPGLTPGFRLQYPGTGSVTDELILRNPNLGNIDRLSMVRINRETRGGTLIVFADPIWPKVQTMLLSFSGLSYQQGQDLIAFMENHLGEEIRLIDWEDRLWKGVIVNPQDPVVQDGPGCRYTASYEFEGEKV